MRFGDGPFTQCYRTRQSQLRYPLLRTKMYTDTMFASQKALGGHTCGQIYATNFDWVRFFPMRKKKEVGLTLAMLIADVGIPSGIVMDGAKETMHGEFKATCDQFHIPISIIEPYSHWQNRAENAIKLFKRGVRRAMLRTGTPQCLWNYCGAWVSSIRCLTAHSTPQLNGRVPEEILTGHTPDISELTHFDWYDLLWFHDPVDFPAPVRRLGRWLGPTDHVGQALCYWVLTERATVISSSTVQLISDAERSDPVLVTAVRAFDLAINS